MTDLIDTTEMYLRTIFEIEEEGGVPLRARIAERLGHSGPTVSQTVARMERDRLLTISGDRHLDLTEEGRALATRVMRKHRLAERLLVDVLALEWEHAHDEACRWEHVVSERVERRILQLLGERLESPYGNPIPGLDELGGPAASGFREAGVVPLTELLDAPRGGTGPDAALVLRRIGEPAQARVELLEALGAIGAVPGAAVRAAREGRGIVIRTSRGEATVTEYDAAHVFVATPV